MALGLLINKAKVVPGEANQYLVTILLWVATPCMVFSSITSRDYDPSILLSTVQMFGLSALFFALTSLIGYFLAAKVFKVPSKDLGVYISGFAGINNGFMGFPITLALFGTEVFYYMVIFNIVLNIYLYSGCPLLLSIGYGKKNFNMKYLVKTLANPSTIVCIVSMFMLVNGLHLPDILFESIDMVGDITVPLSMLVVGMQLGASNAKNVLKNGKLIGMSLIKMLIVPLMMFLIVNWLPIAVAVKVAVILGSAFPCAVIVSAITLLENKNATLASEIVAFTTFISVVTIPLAALFLGTYYGI